MSSPPRRVRFAKRSLTETLQGGDVKRTDDFTSTASGMAIRSEDSSSDDPSLRAQLQAREATLAAAEQRCTWLTRELEKLPELDARILKLQREAGKSAAELTARATQIAELESLIDAERARATETESRLSAQKSHIAHLEDQVAREQSRIAQLTLQLTDAKLSQGTTPLMQPLAQEANAQMHASIADAEARVLSLREELAADRQMSGTLQRKLDAQAESLRIAERARTEGQAQIVALEVREAQYERRIEALSAELQERTEAADRRIAEYEAQLARLAQGGEKRPSVDRWEANGRVQSLEKELKAATQQLRSYQDELRAKDERMGELLTSISKLQAQLEKAVRPVEDADLGLPDVFARTIPGSILPETLRPSLDKLRRQEPATRADVAASAALGPILVRTEGKREIVHALTRKTSIGRTPDNDIQINTSSVSRHHAVILASPSGTLVEDLNSTNGVLVNGKRVTRHPLVDGDVVKIGRAKFRYVAKASQSSPRLARA